MNRDHELSDSELVEEALACSVRQRSLLHLVQLRAQRREQNAAQMRAARLNKKGGSPATEEPRRKSA
jgi:hypothetical protein